MIPEDKKNKDLDTKNITDKVNVRNLPQPYNSDLVFLLLPSLEPERWSLYLHLSSNAVRITSTTFSVELASSSATMAMSGSALRCLTITSSRR